MTIHGKDCYLSYLDKNGKWHVFGGERDCSFNTTTDFQETAGITSGKWKEYIPTKSGWRMQFGGILLDDTDIEELYLSRTQITVRMKKGSRYIRGRAYISSIDESAAIHELGRVSFSLLGTGPFHRE